jgi:hypothetical protein
MISGRLGFLVAAALWVYPVHASPLGGSVKGSAPRKLETHSAIEESASTRVRGPAVSAPYDSVPTDQVKPIARRLQVVSEILSRFGRAYDYRSHTLRELEAILHGLEEATRPDAPADESQVDVNIYSSDEAANG